MMEKFRISVIDFIAESGRHKTGKKDSNNVELCVGDVVQYRDDKYMIVYRYGSFVLKQPMTIHTLGISGWSTTTKINELWSTPDNVICGEISEPFYQQVKHLCGVDE